MNLHPGQNLERTDLNRAYCYEDRPPERRLLDESTSGTEFRKDWSRTEHIVTKIILHRLRDALYMNLRPGHNLQRTGLTQSILLLSA